MSVNINDFQDGWTPLMIAAQNGHSSVLETLLQYGATVDKANRVSTNDEFMEYSGIQPYS